ncbi:MAG: PAS domain-containing protein [Deltaproteobacteria bacterium]|nr:PAS domain-containing protein [Deltaproteobacteria bacterium]
MSERRSGTTGGKDKHGIAAPICSINAPIAILSRDGIITAVNQPFLDLLSAQAHDVMARPLEGFVGTEPFSASFLSRLLKERCSTDIRISLTGTTGEDVPVTLSVAPTDGGAGRTAFICTATDLRARIGLERSLDASDKELSRRVAYIDDFRSGVLHMLRDIDSGEAALEAAYRQLQEAQAELMQTGKLTALGELAASLAHELNQPLTVIKGLSQSIMQSMRVEARDYERVKLITDASRKMELIIKHLSVFTRIEPPETKLVDLNGVIEEARIIVGQLLAGGSVKLDLDLGAPPPVSGSANRLEQVIINLVTNAKDAMPDGGTLRISTATEEKDGRTYARMSFQDTGHGIPADVLPRIFNPFFTTKEVGKGTGLGLSISHRIIKEHSGEIAVETEPGKGCVFHITLPAASRGAGA